MLSLVMEIYFSVMFSIDMVLYSSIFVNHIFTPVTVISRSDILSICVTFHSSDKTWSEIAFHTIIGFINFMKHANVLQLYMLSVYMIYHRGFMFHSEITLYPFSSSVETVIAVRLNSQLFILWNIVSRLTSPKKYWTINSIIKNCSMFILPMNMEYFRTLISVITDVAVISLSDILSVHMCI